MHCRTATDCEFVSCQLRQVFIIIIIILFAEIMSILIHWRQYNDTVCEQDIPGSYKHYHYI